MTVDELLAPHLRVIVCGGKYIVTQEWDGHVAISRHGVPCTTDTNGALAALAYEVAGLRRLLGLNAETGL